MVVCTSYCASKRASVVVQQISSALVQQLGLRLEHIEGCIERGRARRIPGALVVLLAQPGQKVLDAQRPGFPVTIDDEIGKAGAVAGVKELGGRCDIEEDVCTAH